ncbi:TPA: efflux RND transporter periplasmic adaptor subunit [Klebsiella pneumoniae]
MPVTQKFRKRFFIFSFIFFISACDGNEQKLSSHKDIPKVNVFTLRTQPVVISSRLPGRTTAVRTAEVRPQVNGIILHRLFEEGTEVKAGEPLYQIDPAMYKAAYDKAKATLKNAEALQRRYRSLVADNAISKQDYDDANSNAEQARADLETARINVEYTKVRAPISGRIDRSLVTEGALVTNGQSDYLTTITQLDPINVDISESSRSLLELRKMITTGKIKVLNDHEAYVHLALEDGSVYPLEGRLDFSEVRVDESTGSVILRATFPNPDRTLLPGMFVHAVLPQGVREESMLVPQESVGYDNKGQPYVYVVNSKNIVELRHIKTVGTKGDKWIVTSGVQTDERVVTAGIQMVKQGTEVIPSEIITGHDNAETKTLSLTDPSAQ